MRNGGFTLVETIITTALVSFLALAALTLATRVMATGFSVNQKLDAMEEQRLALWTMERAFARAERVSWLSSSLDGSAMTGGQGAVGAYNFTRLSHGAGRTSLLAAFAQNIGSSTSASYVGTALFFRSPTATAPGQLIYVMDSARTGTLAANRPTSVFSNIVEFEISQPRLAAGGTLTGMHLRFVTRSFDQGVALGLRRYCPQADLSSGACVMDPSVKYRDLERRVTVLLPMNASTVPFAKYNLPLGGYLHAQ
ncbi:MAG: prepilin-type N-terminal cleavage/methylation domain-containing protein [Bdellovibrionaceae bacterium]|nr:prepilin-type N-terminal cleavage/methylation domain-containing protein [Pseudobdellovibrionaceae bacterium]MBX3034763.1 prepilin-type N-terminal cleavage/methylation domain-containing protein [Pseudobdellovibrionaceae bacterium]